MVRLISLLIRMMRVTVMLKQVTMIRMIIMSGLLLFGVKTAQSQITWK